jgi:transposase InsO family protein
MSRAGNYWDNAVVKRFFLNPKLERVWQRDSTNQGEVRRDITDHIASFYNDCRLSSKL